MLNGKRILIIMSGGIAAYKALDLIRQLKKAGADVTPVLTRAAQEFITPLSASALAGDKVYTDLFDLTDETGLVARPAMPPFPQENNGRYNLRLTSESTLGFRVDTALTVQLKVKLIYDADPVPGREPLDVATTLNMVLTLI